MAIFRKFLITFLSMFITAILLISLLSYFGMLSNISVNDCWDFDTYYFGFTSVFNAIEHFPQFDYVRLLNIIKDTTNHLTGDLLSFKFMSTGDNILQVLTIVAKLLIAPFTLLLDAVNLLVFIFGFIGNLAIWFIQLLNGAFNSVLPSRVSTPL